MLAHFAAAMITLEFHAVIVMFSKANNLYYSSMSTHLGCRPLLFIVMSDATFLIF